MLPRITCQVRIVESSQHVDLDVGLTCVTVALKSLVNSKLSQVRLVSKILGFRCQGSQINESP
jgi:hypothetical protein